MQNEPPQLPDEDPEPPVEGGPEETKQLIPVPSPQQQPQEFVLVTVEQRISRPRDDPMFPVSHRAWNNLITSIRELPQERRLLENFAYVLFGVGGSDLVSMVVLSITTGFIAVPFTILGLILFGTIVFGLGLLYLDSLRKRAASTSVHNILAKMRDMDEDYLASQDNAPKQLKS